MQIYRPIGLDNRVRVALVGCGRISANHIRAIAAHADKAELVAICDIHQSQLEMALSVFAEAFKGSQSVPDNPLSFTSFEELLCAVDQGNLAVDLVVLATPSGLHSEQAISAANHGLNVCTEKPMATRWEDGIAMVKACDKAGVRLFVVKQNRFNSTLQLVKRQIDKDRFGQIAMIATNVFWQRPQEYYDQASWRGTWEFDGGAIMNQASHYVDLMEWLGGPVESLSASIATLGRKIEAEDTASVQVKWRHGGLGTLAVTMLTYPKNLEGSITIIGDKGAVKIGGPAVNEIKHWTFSDTSDDDELVESASYQTTSVYGFGHPQFYSQMLSALQTADTKNVVDGREGLKSLELIVGIYRSARDKTFTSFPLSL